MRRIRDTSIEVYREMRDNGLLSQRRWEVYDILFHHGPMTSNEVFQHARLHGNPNYRHNTNARMTELRELGVVTELGTRECSVTKRVVILWDVTSKLPGAPPTNARPTRKELERRIAELEAENRELRARLRPRSAPSGEKQLDLF